MLAVRIHVSRQPGNIGGRCSRITAGSLCETRAGGTRVFPASGSFRWNADGIKCIGRLALITLTWSLLFAGCFVSAVETVSAAENRNPAKPADTSSPRETLRSFIEACNELSDIIHSEEFFDRTSPKHHPVAERILDCLDLSEIPAYARQEVAGEAAVCLKEVLDRVEIPPESEIPNIAAIVDAGGPEKMPRWQIPRTRIMIARVEEGPHRHEYLFTPGTVSRINEYYDDIKSLPYRSAGPAVSEGFHKWYFSAPGHPAVALIVRGLPEWTRTQAFGLALWKWAGLVLTILIGLAVMVILYKLYRSLSALFRRQGRMVLYCLAIILPLAAVLVPWEIERAAQTYLTLRGTPLYVVNFAADLTALLAILVVVFAISSRVAEVIIASPHINPQGLDAQVIRITARLASLAAAVIVFLEGGRYLGFPLTTLLASAGVGGLAVALASQDTLKNVFGTIMLMADKPYRVGERIIYGKYDGVVEDIGLRSTRIRLLTGHQATIPNDELARSDIENVGRRPHIRRITDIRIPLDTLREKVEEALKIIRAALEDHEGMEADFPPRVFFNDFNHDSFNIRFICWYHPPQYWDFLAFSERLNLEIFRAFEEKGIPFSLPSRITYTTPDSRPQPVEVRVLSQ